VDFLPQRTHIDERTRENKFFWAENENLNTVMF
jgi:hypothetical protein